MYARVGSKRHYKTELICFMYFKQKSTISTLNVKPLKLVDHFTYLSSNISSTVSPVGWCSRIRQVDLCRGVRLLPYECPGYVIKASDGKALALELWGMGSTLSLPLFPGPL